VVKSGGVLCATGCLSACSSGVLDPHGPVGKSEKLILFDATVIMLAVVLPVILCTLAFAWWYRSGNRHATRRPDWSYSGRIEFVTWSIPALVILFLGGITWISSHELDPPRRISRAGTAVESQALEIQVISLDWKWLFIYPAAGVASVNELVVPVGTPVHFRLTSASVMNSFFVPQLGSQIYTMAGMTTQLNLLADDVGVYRGISAQFSGDGFSDMGFQVRSVASGDFQQWTEAARARGGSLDGTRYSQLAKPSKNEIPATFGSVGDGLFDAVVAGDGALPAGAGPGPSARNFR